MTATKPNFVSAKKSSRKFLAEINSSDEKKEHKRGVKKWYDTFGIASH